MLMLALSVVIDGLCNLSYLLWLAGPAGVAAAQAANIGSGHVAGGMLMTLYESPVSGLGTLVTELVPGASFVPNGIISWLCQFGKKVLEALGALGGRMLLGDVVVRVADVRAGDPEDPDVRTSGSLGGSFPSPDIRITGSTGGVIHPVNSGRKSSKEGSLGSTESSWLCQLGKKVLEALDPIGPN